MIEPSFKILCGPIVLLIILLAGCGERKDEVVLIDLNPLQDELDSLISAENQADNFHGTIVVGNKDSIIYARAVGIADRSYGLPMKEEYRLDIASVNKSFIGALVMIAVQEGKIRLLDKLADRLSDYPPAGSFHPEIEIHHLLTHTSGLADYGAVPSELAENDFQGLKRTSFTNEEYVQFISSLEPVAEPGQRPYYSNFAYHLLCIILEDAYDRSFADLLEEKICTPLGLQNTFVPVSRGEVYKDMIDAYTFNAEDSSWRRNSFIDLSIGRRIYSTSRDLYKWALAMDGNEVLTPESLELMQTNQLSEITDVISYGYGWVVHPENSGYGMGNLKTDRPYVIHGGSTEGFKAMVFNIANGETVVAFLSNTGNRTDEMGLAQKVVRIVEKH